MKINWRRSALVYLVIIIGAVALISLVIPSASKPKEIALSEAIAMSQRGEIDEILVDGNALNITDIYDTEFLTFKESGASIYEIEGLNLTGITVEIEGSTGLDWGSLLINFLPLLIFGGLLFFLFSQARGANSQAMSFGRSKARLFPANTPTVTFDDVAGVDEAKQELTEVVDFLKEREKYQALGARIPKGMLLIGPPGIGKTLLARAIAGEAGVPFYSISGSEFVEMFVGVGASRVRDLFDQAKRNAPCIIFIDEIDAVGRHRGAGMGGGHDEREQTLNQILVEMDGFDTNTNVIVLAATNRPDILDPALLRPGRFDRRVVLDLPDINGRTAILKVHSKGKPLGKSVKLGTLARLTVGFSGADLANLINEAAILAARRNKKSIAMQDLEESIDRVIAGPERKSLRISPKEKKITAYHEAGHAIVAKLLPNADPPHKISIVARGRALGYTKPLQEDRYMWSRAQFKDTLAMILGGRAAEELILHEITTGAQDDIKKATNLARKMVTDYGMSDKLGLRSFGDKQEMVFLGREIAEQKDYGDKIADLIDDEVHNIIEHAYNTAKATLTKNQPLLKRLAKQLITKETLDDKALEVIFAKPMAQPKPETKEELTPAEARVTAKTKPKDKKAPSILHRPKQAPAAS